MAGKSTAQTDANYNGVKKAQQAAASTMTKQQRKALNAEKNQAYAQKQRSKPTAATAAHQNTTKAQATPQPQADVKNVKASTANMDNMDTSGGSGGPKAPEAQAAAADVKSKSKVAGEDEDGILKHLSDDMRYTTGAFEKTAEVMGGGRAKGALAAGAEGATGALSGDEAWKELKTIGGDYLNQMGRGHKGLGVAKLGAYAVGATMLVDMLNPFDDD